MFDVVTFGASSQDNFIKISEEFLHFVKDPKTGNELVSFEHNAKIPVQEAASFPGGGALNSAIALKRLGLKPLVVSAVGWDNFGEIILNKLQEAGIRRDYVLRLQGVHTAFSTIISTAKGDRTAFVFGGATEHLSKELLPPFEKLAKAEIFAVSHLRGEGHKLLKDIFDAKQFKPDLKIAWNPGSTQIQHGVAGLKEYLTKTDVLLMNREEAQSLLGKTQATSSKDLVEGLRAAGPHIAVVTDGNNGALAATPRGTMKISRFPAEVINTTGAGDSFFAGLIAGLHYAKNIEKGLIFGSINAASTISYLGAQNGYLSRAEIENVIHDHPEFHVEAL